MRKRLRIAWNRAKYASMGAAAGAFLGGLVSRNAASTGGGIGALVGATLGEKALDAGAFVDRVKQKTDQEGDGRLRRGVRQRSE